MTSTTYKTKSGSSTVVFAIVATLTMGVMLLLNLQPWFVIGRDIVSQIDTGPLLGLANWIFGGTLAKVLAVVFFIIGVRIVNRRKFFAAQFIICGFILLFSPSALIQALGELVGFLMWAWIQFVQVSPMLAQHSLIPANAKWMAELKQYRAIAYGAEALACFIKYPPYAGGDVDRMMSDITSLSVSASQWDWGNFFWAIAVMMCVEMTFKFLLKAGVYCGAFVQKQASTNPSAHYTQKSASGSQATWQI